MLFIVFADVQVLLNSQQDETMSNSINRATGEKKAVLERLSGPECTSTPPETATFSLPFHVSSIKNIFSLFVSKI